MFLSWIWYVLECLVLCPYVFLAYWMALNPVELCFRLMWILWRKACRWLKACNRWLVLNLLNMCSMMRAGYAMLLSECLCLNCAWWWDQHSILQTFQAHRMETADATKRTLEERIRGLEVENHQYDPRFFSSQEGNTKGGSSRGGSRRSSRWRTWSSNNVWLVFFFFFPTK